MDHWVTINYLTILLFSIMYSLFNVFYFSNSHPFFLLFFFLFLRLTVAVVVAFFICWAPFHAQRLMAIHVTQPTSTEEIIFMILTHISGITYYVSATINPILYSIMSLKFRQAFKDTLGRWCGRSGRRSPTTAFVTTGHFDERTTCHHKSQV